MHKKFVSIAQPDKYIVKDGLGKMADRIYFTPYHAEQMARALNLHEGSKRFSINEPQE